MDASDQFGGMAGHSFMPQQSPVHPQGATHGQGPPTYPQYSATAPSTAPRSVRPPNRRLVTDILNALATPPREIRKPVWKSERRLPPIKVGTPVPRPEPEPLSPVLKRTEPPARSTRSTRNRGATLSEQPEELEALPMPMPTRTRGRSRRDRSPHSAVSSTADESRITRSQSVSTTAGVLPASDDRPSSRGNVKVEPSTPAGFVDDVSEAPQELPSGVRMTRKRRGTLHTLPQPPGKRRRQHSTADQDMDDTGTPPPKPKTVLATRNFHKLSATIMNDINSHKHASYFANLVRDKDAPGYSDIIKHPQNLKSIRTAIAAGTRAVNSAVAAMDSPSTPTSKTTAADGSTTVELDRTEDIIPPKGIVNAAQLEKEVCRMFANAVMFNPGEDGMVSDTREMFEDIDAKIQEWRGAEKESGAPGTDGEEEISFGKRRKL